MKQYLNYKNSGFTLIELMITIALAAVLLSIAVPSFTDAIKRNRLTTQLNNSYIALKVARSEAVKLGSNVTVCSSTDQTTCNGDVNWHNGWVILDTAGTVVRVGSALESGTTLVASAEDTSKSETGVIFRPDGLVNDPTSGGVSRLSLVLQVAGCGVGEQRTITISNLGISTISSDDCP